MDGRDFRRFQNEMERDRERLRKQKRESEARRRALRREQAVHLRRMFGKLLNEYGTYNRHVAIMRAIRNAGNR